LELLMELRKALGARRKVDFPLDKFGFVYALG
jgi:hypothetical protein